MKARRVGLVLLAVVAVLAVALVAAIAFGGPHRPPPLASISAPFRGLDMSALPPVQRFTARDGANLAFRRYGPAAAGVKVDAKADAAHGSVVLVHGSSANSRSLHPLAAGLAAAGFTVFALDTRGHGESGRRGHIAYIGQLEDDLEDFVRSVQPAAPRALIGFSSGGGFALRFAADARQTLFDRYLLLSPFLSVDASTQRPDSGGWVGVGVPRIVALLALNGVGITAFNDLPVLSFALDEATRALLTPDYSFALLMNFGPHRDYRADIRAAKQPMQLLAGTDDELFYTDRFAAEFAAAGRPVPVTLVPGVGHIGLTLQPAAVTAISSALLAPPR